MRRVAIVGPAAAGKSTLASRLSALLGIPAYHLDALYWRPGWTRPRPEEWEAELRRLVDSPEWIIDGNFTDTMRERLDAADTVIYLDFHPVVSTVGAVRRRLLYPRRPAPGMQVGSRPMFNLQLFRWIWSFPRDHRPAILRLLEEQRGSKRVLVLRKRAEVERLLRDLERDREA
jgi:adenylate kinase family enzyme